MTTVDFIIALFYQVDNHLHDLPKHPHATLWPSEVVTLGLLHALKGVGNRAFYRWLTRDYRALFPRLPERTRLFRLFITHQDWTTAFLATPTVRGIIDTYGIELIHPMREGRSARQIGRKGLSNHRWIVGGKRCLVLNQWGAIVAWDCATAHVVANTFQWLIRQFDERMIILSDMAFHAAEGDPANLKLCRRGEWHDRILIENDAELRRTINAATNIAEAWNGLIQWVAFGGDGVIRQNNREEQRKIIRDNHLVANCVVFHNVVSMTRVLQALIDEGYPVTPEIIARLAPYKIGHINRFGHYDLRFDQPPPPITEELRLAPALAVS